MSDLKRRLQRLETLSKTGDVPVIALVFSDGACVDGAEMTLGEYQERFTGDNEPNVIVNVGGLSVDDI